MITNLDREEYEMDDFDQFQLLSLQADQIKAELDSMLLNKEITEARYNKDITSLAYEFRCSWVS